MRRARTWGWARTRRYDDPSKDLGPYSLHRSCPDGIIATRGYDFREGHLRVIRFGLDASRNVSQMGNYNSVRRFKIALQSGWQRQWLFECGGLTFDFARTTTNIAYTPASSAAFFAVTYWNFFASAMTCET